MGSADQPPDPTPVRCPVEPGTPSADPVGLDPLLDRLADPTPVDEALAFPLGTLQPDGRLDLCKQALGPVGAARIAPAAAASPHAVHLLLGTNNLGSTGAASVADALGPGHRMRTVYLGCNHIDAEGVRPLAERLTADTTVRGLWLKRNPIGDAGVAHLSAALRHNTALRTLDLTNTGISPAGLRTLVTALAARAVPLDRLYLGGNGFGPESADTLAALFDDALVRELFVAAGRLGDDGARRLAAALRPGRRAVLGLGGNGLGPSGVAALAERLGGLSGLDLARPPSARALDAVPNVVGDLGAAALADALPGSGLRRLDLRHTGVTGRGARRLLDALDGMNGSAGFEQFALGSGVPRRIKRAVAARLAPASPPAEDVAAIVSVYR
jgi:hypothetical protein